MSFVSITSVIADSGCFVSEKNKGISVSISDPAPNKSTSNQSGPSTPSLDDFEQLLLLGHGGTCIVYLVRKISTGRLYALKQRILRTIAEIDSAPKSLLALEASWSDAKYYYLLTPWCAGKDLASLLLGERKLSSDRVKFYMSQLVLALETLHDLNIVHRDIKTANIFITGNGNLILGDFGLAKQFCPSLMHGSAQPFEISFDVDPNATGGSFLIPSVEDLTCTTNERCGTPSWMSPAQIAGSAYSFDADVWGLGMVMFKMLTGRLPCDDSGVAEADVTFRASDCVDPVAQDLVRGLLNKDQSARMTIVEAKQHPYFRNVNWAAVAGHTERAPWTPLPASVPVQPRKTPLTTGVPYCEGEDRLPEFVYATPGFFSPPPGPLKAFVLKLAGIFRSSRKVKANRSPTASPSAISRSDR
ncbi:kinase-like domain-containing protein [Favolaschia claudopus]|uniref:Kinase-like domain-containing protein n=1 Tax=Favolaschia claudopus TaxID=2862362 RepID=A0AAW0DVD0_9AGAR